MAHYDEKTKQIILTEEDKECLFGQKKKPPRWLKDFVDFLCDPKEYIKNTKK